MTTTIDGFTPTPARTSARPTVTYREYVADFGKSAAGYLFLATAGTTIVTGAAMYLSGKGLIIFIAVGLGLAAAGLGGLAAITSAHAAYTRHLGMTTSTTYQPARESPAVRPFVASRNAGHTVRVGRFQLPAATWAALLAAAEANDGRLTRDAAVKVLPRAMYRDWQATADELRRLGLIDDAGRVMADGWRFIRRGVSPYPDNAEAEPGTTGTHAPRTHGAHDEATA